MKAKQGMMISLLVLILAQAIVSCVSCNSRGMMISGSGPMTIEERPLRNFDRIEIYGSPTVYYTQADNYAVHVKAPEDLVEKIVTSVEDHTLIIRSKLKVGVVNISFNDMNKFVINVSSPDLVGVTLNGSGDFISKFKLDTDNMDIVLRGSGDIDFSDIICDHCVTELVGSGDININRLEAQTSEATLIGSGDIEIRQWNVGKTDAVLRGSGDISIDFVEGCQRATCQLTGSGDIDLKGKVVEFSKQKSGSGDIDIDKLTIEK